MKLAPSDATQKAIKFWLDCLQIVTVIIAIVTAYATFRTYISDQNARAAEAADRASVQAQQATEQLAATKRELERPYQEKKLAVYLEAAGVLAHLATMPDVDREKTEARFWELYWGELAFVESETKDEGPDQKSVERLMVDFCQARFSLERCKAATQVEAAAFDMAHQASREIRARAESIGK